MGCDRILGHGLGIRQGGACFAGGRYGIRKRLVSADLVPVADALPMLLSVNPGTASRPDAPVRQSVSVWSAAATARVGLVARGRLLPTVTADGADAWRAGPPDRADLAWLAELAAAFPAAAHALAVPGSRPMRLRGAEPSTSDSRCCAGWRGVALTAAIWHNDHTCHPIKRSLIASDH